MNIANKNITLLSLLKVVEKLGYTVITYDEAKELLQIKPFEITNYYFTYFLGYKKYFVYNNYKSLNELKRRIILFLKRSIILFLKRSIKKGGFITFLFIFY